MTPALDALRPLVVIDTLEVGPVRLERDRLVTPYTVHTGDRSATTELVYRYTEPVFDPDDPHDRNLATIIGAQIALNYGLFCRRIVVRGPVDRTDRRSPPTWRRTPRARSTSTSCSRPTPSSRAWRGSCRW